MLATAVSLDYLHDAWFYWTHRLLHWQPLYRSVHRIHHECAKGPSCANMHVILPCADANHMLQTTYAWATRLQAAADSIYCARPCAFRCLD